MMRQSGQRRVGFSLLEMLIVMTIIIALLALLLGGVQKARSIGKRTATAAQMAAIGNAIGSFKGNSSFGGMKYVPPGAYNNGAWGPFRLRDTYPAAGTAANGEPDINSFEAQYIIQVFGVRPTQNSSGQPYIATLGFPGIGKPDLDANQTLLFFLCGIPQVSGGDCVFTGFSANSQAPFTPRATAAETRTNVNFDPSGGSPRGYVVDPAPPHGNSFPRLVDGWGRPFAYFAAYNGQANTNYGGFNPPQSATYTSGTGPSGVYPQGLVPYQLNGQYVAASGYQLISPGEDGLFGLTGNWASVDAHGQDDRASFSTGNLGSGPPSTTP